MSGPRGESDKAPTTTRVNMKKIFSLALVLMLTSMMTLPASAQNRERYKC